MQILDIRNRIHDPTRPEDIGVLRVESIRYYPSLMFPLFEVRVRETEEDLGELVFGKEVGEEFHGVGADAGDVLKATGF